MIIHTHRKWKLYFNQGWSKHPLREKWDNDHLAFYYIWTKKVASEHLRRSSTHATFPLSYAVLPSLYLRVGFPCEKCHDGWCYVNNIFLWEPKKVLLVNHNLFFWSMESRVPFKNMSTNQSISRKSLTGSKCSQQPSPPIVGKEPLVTLVREKKLTPTRECF